MPEAIATVGLRRRDARSPSLSSPWALPSHGARARLRFEPASGEGDHGGPARDHPALLSSPRLPPAAGRSKHDSLRASLRSEPRRSSVLLGNPSRRGESAPTAARALAPHRSGRLGSARRDEALRGAHGLAALDFHRRELDARGRGPRSALRDARRRSPSTRFCAAVWLVVALARTMKLGSAWREPSPRGARPSGTLPLPLARRSCPGRISR